MAGAAWAGVAWAGVAWAGVAWAGVVEGGDAEGGEVEGAGIDVGGVVSGAVNADGGWACKAGGAAGNAIDSHTNKVSRRFIGSAPAALGLISS